MKRKNNHVLPQLLIKINPTSNSSLSTSDPIPIENIFILLFCNISTADGSRDTCLRSVLIKKNVKCFMLHVVGDQLLVIVSHRHNEN